jgi:hypothetical protein
MGAILSTADRSKLSACPDGARLSVPGDPACCDAQPCPLWVRFVPCGTQDCTGDKTPGTGPPVWLCRTAICSNVFASPGINETVTGRPQLIVLVGGECYRHDNMAVNDPAQIPPGEMVLTDTVFECRTGGCAGCSPTSSGWALAQPCDPNYNGPPVYFCKATLLRPCVVTAAFGGCHRYRLDSPTINLAADAPGIRVLFPPDWQWDSPPGNFGSCCRCACVPDPPILEPIACPELGPWPGGCCDQTSIDNGNSYARIDYYIEQRFSGDQTLIQHIRGFGPARAVPCRQRERFIVNGVELYDIEYPIGDATVACPAGRPVLGGSDMFTIFANPGLTVCDEFRAYNLWRWSQTFVPPGSGPGELRITRGEVRLFQVDRAPCLNQDCLGGFTPTRPGVPVPDVPAPGGPQPATEGTGGGTITTRGGGSRPVGSAMDAQAAAVWEQQQRLGGCRGCGDGWVG